jgi:predicted RNase H-like HicB family nuclease
MTDVRLSFRVFWYEPDQEWVGVCEQFPSLSHLDETPEAALAGIRELVVWTVEDLKAEGRPMPWEVAERAPLVAQG